MSSIQGFLIAANSFIGNVLIPFLFGIALLVFIFNAFRYFIYGADQEDSRTKAKQLAIYAIAGLVFLVSIWGIVNMFTAGLDVDRENPVTSDYFGR